MEDWLNLQHASGQGPDCPTRMAREWITAPGALPCARCGMEIVPGELFLLTGRCAMGGEVAGGERLAAYSDVLEPHAEHLHCLPPRREPECLTIGHGTRPLEEFSGILRERGVEVLADIRTVPKSRHNPQYASQALGAGLGERGICYLHLPELGGLRKPRPDSPNAGWRNESFRGYADYMLTPVFETALQELIALLRVRPAAIMCAETVYWRCHRSLVADALTVRGIPVQHLMAPGKAEPHRLTRFARADGTRLVYPPEEDALPERT